MKVVGASGVKSRRSVVFKVLVCKVFHVQAFVLNILDVKNIQHVCLFEKRTAKNEHIWRGMCKFKISPASVNKTHSMV